MVKVHVWLPDGDHVGHCALTVGSDYVSFWPDGGAHKKDLTIKRSQPGLWMQDLREDIVNEGGLTRRRVDIGIPLQPGTSGKEYLARLDQGLNAIVGTYRLAFVVAGTDVLASDPLGGLKLTVADCLDRDAMVLARLKALAVPAVVVGGGGYGKESASAVVASLRNLGQVH